MFTGIPCRYSAWGQYVITPQDHQKELLVVNDPLMVTGINPSLHKCNDDQEKEAKRKVKTKVLVDMSKYFKSSIKCVKDETTRGSVKCSSNTPAVKINQTPPKSHRSVETKSTQPANSKLPKTSNGIPQAKNKMASKKMNSFQPCNTCKQIVEQRKQLFVEFKSTLQKANSGDESESITKEGQSCNGKEDVSPVACLPVVSNDTKPNREEEDASFKACSPEHAPKLPLEKSDLIKSKERVEKHLQERRKQLDCFIQRCHVDVSTSPDHSYSENINSIPEGLTVKPTETIVHSPTSDQYDQSTVPIDRRCGFIDNDIPIPNEGNYIRILQKSPPNKNGFVSWHNVACIKLRGYQVEIIRSFVYHLGVSYWRLRYLVPQAASVLTHNSWVQINSLYFNVMMMPCNVVTHLSIFNAVTLAEFTDNEIVKSKDPDLLMDKLKPIPNAFSPLQAEQEAEMMQPNL